jgi:hypothetical protein
MHTVKTGNDRRTSHFRWLRFVISSNPHYSYCQYHSRMSTKQCKTINTLFCFLRLHVVTWWSTVSSASLALPCCLHLSRKDRDIVLLVLLPQTARYHASCTPFMKGAEYYLLYLSRKRRQVSIVSYFSNLNMYLKENTVSRVMGTHINVCTLSC